MGEVYCLYSTRDGVPRYVGQTEYTAEKHHRLHVTNALEKGPGSLYDWVRDEWRQGSEVKAWVLQDEIIPVDLEMYETYWQEQFVDLLNTNSSSIVKRTTEVGHRVMDNILAHLKGASEG